MDKDIQDYPVFDNDVVEAFEAIVEAYYQSLGYITSTNKNFWARGQNQQQRGYQDIDVLAIKEKETVIVSVTNELNDKTSDLPKLEEFFQRARKYLKKTPEYQWLATEERLKNQVVYILGPKKGGKRIEEIEKRLRQKKIELMDAEKIIEQLKKYFEDKDEKGYKITNNKIVRVMQVLNVLRKREEHEGTRNKQK